MPVYLAVANSLVVDFLARQRVMGKKMALSILDGLPIARLARDDERAAWLARAALRLTCTDAGMTPFWNQMAVYGWVDALDPVLVPGVVVQSERRALRADVDAYVAKMVYTLGRSDLELVLDSFTQLAGIETKRDGEFTTRRLVLEAFDKMPDADTSSDPNAPDEPGTVSKLEDAGR